MKNGYWGRMLRVDLTTKTYKNEELPERVLREFIGGSGIASQILYEEVGPNVGALDPENRLIFALGPWQAARLVGNGKLTVASKSPLTESYGESSGGGSWGPLFKATGYDALVVQGKACDPVYLWIQDSGVEIRDARGLWGIDALETSRTLKKRLGEEKSSVACIGPAGEKVVRFACIAFDEYSFAGRCGMGAVMGSKNLKAVAVAGTKQCPVFDPQQVTVLEREFSKTTGEGARESGFREHGTPLTVTPSAQTGNLPVKYWSEGVWEGGEIGAPSMTKVLNIKPRVSCSYCPIGCHRQVNLSEPLDQVAGPQYETLGLLGSACLISDLRIIAEANLICNQYGMDTIAAGACVGFAMESFERGWLTKQDTEGMEIKWGDGKAAVELLKKIGRREGVGRLFAEGTLRMAKNMGKEAEDTVVQVRGLDFPAWDPRALWATALDYATGTIGSSHERGISPSIEMGLLLPELGITETPEPFTSRGKPYIAMKAQDFAVLMNSLTCCNFTVDGCGVSLSQVLDIFNAITGWKWSMEILMRAAERIFNLQRLLNIRYGKGGDSDTLPRRMFEPAKTGPRAGKTPPLEKMLPEYYRLRGWDERGNPTAEKLEELGLSAA